jgi:hypothetical protein
MGYVTYIPNIRSQIYRAFDIKCTVYHPDLRSPSDFVVRCFWRQNKRWEKYPLPKVGNLIHVSGPWIGQAMTDLRPLPIVCVTVEDYKNLGTVATTLKEAGRQDGLLIGSTAGTSLPSRMPPGFNVSSTSRPAPVSIPADLEAIDLTRDDGGASDCEGDDDGDDEMADFIDDGEIDEGELDEIDKLERQLEMARKKKTTAKGKGRAKMSNSTLPPSFNDSDDEPELPVKAEKLKERVSKATPKNIPTKAQSMLKKKGIPSPVPDSDSATGMQDSENVAEMNRLYAQMQAIEARILENNNRAAADAARPTPPASSYDTDDWPDIDDFPDDPLPELSEISKINGKKKAAVAPKKAGNPPKKKASPPKKTANPTKPSLKKASPIKKKAVEDSPVAERASKRARKAPEKLVV